MCMAGAGQQQGMSRGEHSRAEQGRKTEKAGQEVGLCRVGARKEQGRSMAGAGQKRELERSRLRG